MVLVRGGATLIAELANRLAKREIGLASLYAGTCLRWLVHLEIDDQAVDAEIAATDDFFANRP